MGLFDFLRRKPARSLGSDRVEGDLDEPRCCHYMLAHIALREFAHERPLSYMGILASPEARRFLASMIQAVSDQCAKTGPGADFDVDDLTIHTVRVGEYPCAIVEMPTPRAVPEAYFAAAILSSRLGEEPPGPEEASIWYYTLEKSFSLDGPPRTVLGGWTPDGRHSNFGDGPPPRLESFVSVLQKKVSGG